MAVPALPPGFGFHPTEIELILFYLKYKVLGRKLTTINKVIPEIDLYNSSPEDISGECFKSRYQHGYFFFRHERKFAGSSRKKRSTISGQWRTTGKDTPISYKSQTVGMKRTLVFYLRGHGQPERTNWVIHEYRICDQQLGASGVSKNGYVLCKISKKKSSDQNNNESADVENWEDDAYSDDNAIVLDSFLTGGLGPGKPCSSKDIMEDSVSYVPDNTSLTVDISGITGLEVTSHLEALSSHKTNAKQDSSFSIEKNSEVDADNGIVSDVSSFCQLPDIYLPSECNEDSIVLETTLLRYPREDILGRLGQQEATILTQSSSNHPSEVTPELESHGGYMDIFELPSEELFPIDPECYCSMEFDQHQQQQEIAFMHNASFIAGGINPIPDLLGNVAGNLEGGTAAAGEWYHQNLDETPYTNASTYFQLANYDIFGP